MDVSDRATLPAAVSRAFSAKVETGFASENATLQNQHFQQRRRPGLASETAASAEVVMAGAGRIAYVAEN
jgi:hypothetical protein